MFIAHDLENRRKPVGAAWRFRNQAMPPLYGVDEFDWSTIPINMSLLRSSRVLRAPERLDAAESEQHKSGPALRAGQECPRSGS